MTIQISVDEMEQFFKRLIQRIKDDKIDFIDVETDYYWIINSDVWDNFDVTPDISVGSLIDDWNSLQKVLTSEQMVTYLDYDRFASILRALSETISPLKKKNIENSSP
ncbi:hypothetical protein H6S82_21410 [Planktothrix sp. FACHB-1355]|uniref:Uncharacterized protein n=1 Tax=Aerosakkonema funiforme FACHB-1375 TaxID=2949571 RepID=A0A926ZGK5_9CYAN|nr:MULTISPECIES: hypothetical protein [Oscillatoriales]MBD2181644.1 hypothetical protein [Aerosakkonema funiforme FACHB-1375]MBD3561378.1 hypothetical protein [Planktothrix sp. FACHB-1355]